ncbi:MAG: PKD domain-containing protein [Candidatus Competibacteraceae bacterium]|nr:PKD domain-containing protein [Candidatus Competibacteraceae bacterium]
MSSYKNNFYIHILILKRFIVKKTGLLLLTTLLLTTTTFSQQNVYQLSDGGEPWGYKHSEADRDILYEVMPGFDVQAMLDEDLYNETHFSENPGPWRFGHNYFVQYNLQNTGIWTTLENGDRIWRLGVVCPQALTINLAFQYVSIPDGAKLFVYNGKKTESLGAFTQQYVSPDYYFATELLSGDTIIVEYLVPANLHDIGSLELFRITHGYRSATEYVEKAFLSSGSCNMNVNCPDGLIWSNQKRSAVMLVSGGSGFCSGAVINNSCNDGKPYVLTANHCGSSGFSTWTFRFNWESPTCSNPASSPSYVSITGSTSRASRSAADMRLVEINSAIPSNYNVYYAGWSKSATPPPSAFGIHHPSGDIKKISFDDAPLGITTAMGGETNCCWEVEWDRNTTTEGGSSGSPLFDNNGRIIGQLWGGGASCTNLSAPDYYGRVSQNWAPSGSPNNGQLKYWLDPTSCSTNAEYIDGYDPNSPSVALDAQMLSITAPGTTVCSGTNITPVVVLKNNGTTVLTSATITYVVDGGSPVNYAWSGSLASTATTNVTLAPFSTGAGAHTITVTVSNPNGSSDMNSSNDAQTKNFSVVNPTGISLPFAEGFDAATFPPTNWANENPDNNTGSALWVRTTTVSGFGTSTACAKIDHASPSSSTAGQVDNLITPYLNLTTASSPSLSFSVANARYSASYYDSLIVYITTDCGGNWTRLASYGNNTGASPLATAPDVTSAFVPTNTQWATKNISLNAYASQTAVQIRFQLRSGWGNVTYLDDINISASATVPPTASFTPSATTICAGQNINFTNTSSGATSYSWSLPGGTPSTSTSASPSVIFNTAGTYTVTLTANNVAGTSTSTATITVNATPTALATNNGAICQGSSATLTATGGGTYSWSNGSTSSTSIVSPSANTSYTVTVTSANGCTATSSTTVTVLDCSSIEEILHADNLLLFPNPASSHVQLQVSMVSPEPILIEWLTPIGQQVQTYMLQPLQNQIYMPVDALSSGMYLIRISDGTNSITKRMLIIK